jgi:hypothetical protein
MLGNGESTSGRRRRVTKEGQALPLFMTAGRSRTTEQVTLSVRTSNEMHKYLRWASEAAGMSRDEAQIMMLDRALGDYLKKDEAWQAEKAATGTAGGGEDAAEDGQGGSGARVQPPPPRPAASSPSARGPDGAPEIPTKGAATEGAKAK